MAEALLHGARAPIILAPRGYANGDHASPRTIAAAYDATPESDAALRSAEGLALSTGASLEVLTVVAPSAVVSKVLVESRSLTPELYSLVETGIDDIDEAVDVHPRMLIGPIADTVADACTDDVDLLVTGSRNYWATQAGVGRLCLHSADPRGAVPGAPGTAPVRTNSSKCRPITDYGPSCRSPSNLESPVFETGALEGGA